MRKFADIIERIEYIRNYLHLNKSKFSALIGMKPQTYNNFIGAQGSKPNIELIHGVVNRFKVNPGWLLNGTGQVFTGKPTDLDMAMGWEGLGLQVDPLARQHLESLNGLREELKTLDPVLKEVEARIKGLGSSQEPLLSGLAEFLGKYIELDPVGATREIRMFLQRLMLRVDKIS